MAVYLLPKQRTRVRFSYPAPICAKCRFGASTAEKVFFENKNIHTMPENIFVSDDVYQRHPEREALQRKRRRAKTIEIIIALFFLCFWTIVFHSDIISPFVDILFFSLYESANSTGKWFLNMYTIAASFGLLCVVFGKKILGWFLVVVLPVFIWFFVISVFS